MDPWEKNLFLHLPLGLEHRKQRRVWVEAPNALVAFLTPTSNHVEPTMAGLMLDLQAPERLLLG